MANYIFIASSIDGYIATKDGGMDWLMDLAQPDKGDGGFQEFMDKMDALVMGRHTFEKVLSFDTWPYTKKVFVLSHGLKSLPENLRDKAAIISGDVNKVVTQLNERGFKNLYIDGGQTIQSFLKKDLIQEMIITRAAVLLGEGIPLFGPLASAMNFTAIRTEIINPFLVKTHFIRKS